MPSSAEDRLLKSLKTQNEISLRRISRMIEFMDALQTKEAQILHTPEKKHRRRILHPARSGRQSRRVGR